jgi:hypothetical protein
MKNLLYKEFTLCTNVQTVLFMCLGPFMMWIPNYPRYVPFYYSCIGVFMLFVWGMTNNDMVYTACLPVKRSDIVKARFLFTGFLELFEIGICVPFGIIGNNLTAKGNMAGINATVAFYGILLILYSLFNFTFLVLCYKKIEKPTLPFLLGSLVYWTGYAAAEMPVWLKMPFGAYITATDTASQIKQIPLLTAGILVWLSVLVLTFRICVKEFEKVNL